MDYWRDLVCGIEPPSSIDRGVSYFRTEMWRDVQAITLKSALQLTSELPSRIIRDGSMFQSR